MVRDRTFFSRFRRSPLAVWGEGQDDSCLLTMGSRIVTSSPKWKKGRGRLGVLDPLLGSWIAKGDSQIGNYTCVRTFASALENSCVILDAYWTLPNKIYQEHAIIRPNDDGVLAVWSFTSDGKRSEGSLSDGSDVDPSAIAFVSQMPAGLARMIYWPADSGFNWAVESKSKKGWNRFSEHRYIPYQEA
jgi:hypothetical protein